MTEPDFIEAYPNILSGEFCQHLINNFDASPDATPGVREMATRLPLQ